MSITVLSDVIAPNRLWSAAVSGTQARKNARARNQSGAMRINIVRSRTLRTYQFGTVPMLPADWQALEGLHEVTEGGAYGFLAFDPKDGKATHENGFATLISAGAHTYQLIKRYTSAGSTRTKDRKITRPRAAGFDIRISGAPELSYTLNVETGVITIPSDPPASAVTWSAPYYVPVHFQDDNIDWDLVIAGPEDTRYMVGPTVTLDEVIE